MMVHFVKFDDAAREQEFQEIYLKLENFISITELINHSKGEWCCNDSWCVGESLFVYKKISPKTQKDFSCKVKFETPTSSI